MDWTIIRCAFCRDRLDGCRGLHGEWMHRATRSEFCADGVTVCRPFTPQDVDEAKAAAAAMPCAECGSSLPQRGDDRGGRRRYCSMTCSASAAQRRAAERRSRVA